MIQPLPIRQTITAKQVRVLLEFKTKLYQEEQDFQRQREHCRLNESLKTAVQQETGQTLDELLPEEILGPDAYDIYVKILRLI